MKIQNLAIIFLVIVIPLIIVLSYYLNLQQDTLTLQAEYDAKLTEATKEGIKAFEVNTVDWSNKKENNLNRNNVSAMINAFITSLSNNLQISGTAKEYMLNYIPATAVTMYDGYYIYSPTYTPVTFENIDGVQLFLDSTGKITTDSDGKILYEAKNEAAGEVAIKSYDYANEAGSIENIGIEVPLTTDSAKAKTEYKHTLNSKIAYAARYVKGDTNVVVNYTLDNRIYVYGNVNDNYIEKDGYLINYDKDNTILPRITIDPDRQNQDDIIKVNSINDTVYVKKVDEGKAITNETKIEPELLEEQIVYNTGTEHLIKTFPYIYDVEHEKLYYDQDSHDFFTIDSESKRRVFINNEYNENIKVGDEGCKYKSVSVLVSNTEYTKIYQVLNGKDKYKWYIDIKEDTEGGDSTGKVEVDTQIKGEKLGELGLDNLVIYKDLSSISYYVEAYAFTNWVDQNLKGDLIQQKLEYTDDETKAISDRWNYPEESKNTITKDTYGEYVFDIGDNNDPEDPNSAFVQHKKEVMKDNIITNLNLAISNYNNDGNYSFGLPVLKDSDWEQIFSNVSMLTFFQGIPIGLKEYNNYAIATSTTNREYVDPGEIYFRGEGDNNYHRPYCEKCGNIVYTGYRSTEYTLREYTYENEVDKVENSIYYYQHDRYEEGDTSSQTACYYCIVNKANFKATSAEEITYKQAKAYNQALARERYYQKEALQAKVNITITYDPGLAVGGYIEEIININPNTQEAEPGESINLTEDTPEVKTKLGTVWEFQGWEDKKTNIVYDSGALASFEEDVTLYAKWQPRIDSLNWNEDFTSSISTISRNNNNVNMVGNRTNAGKGAIWLNWKYYGIDIVEVSFDYDISFGDSFSAAGILLNVEDTNPDNPHEGQLKGIMLSFNCLERQTDMTSFFKNTGSIANLWENFTYNKGKWNQTFKRTDMTGYCQNLNIAKTGHVTIKVTDSGYEIDINGEKHNIDLGGVPVNQNSIGFFSDHGDHNCSQIGSFIIENVNLKVEVSE